MTIQFETSRGEGVFVYPDDEKNACETLYDILDEREAGNISDKAYIALLDRLVIEKPWFVDGYAHLGYALLEDGKTKKALNALLRGVCWRVSIPSWRPVGENSRSHFFRELALSSFGGSNRTGRNTVLSGRTSLGARR